MKNIMQVSNIIEYLKTYTDERLAALRAHCEDGKLSWYSCSCVDGARDADHPLLGHGEFCGGGGHGLHSDRLALDTSIEFGHLGKDDQERRERVLPLIVAEQARRERERKQQPQGNPMPIPDDALDIVRESREWARGVTGVTGAGRGRK